RKQQLTKQLDGPSFSLLSVHDSVANRTLADLVHDFDRRIEGCRRTLRDIADILAAQPTQLLLRQIYNICFTDKNCAAADPASGSCVPKRGQPTSGFARTRLANEAEHLAPC